MAAVDRETITGLSAVKTLDSDKVLNCERVWLQATAQNVRMTFDGTAPEAAVGIQLVASAVPLEVLSVDARSAKFIEETSSATLEVVYFKGEGAT